jgi:glyoxylase-like metal-dependent hydrolase (beta-lactamase superfamily II)
MSENAYRFRVGALEGIAVRDAMEVTAVADLIPDVGDPVVAEALSRRGWSATEMTFDFLGLFVRSGRERIVIDAGWGPCSDEHKSQFAENLREAGVAPSDVTFVILTHLDLDHAGGVIDPDGGLSFPNARVVVAENAWTWYTSEETLATMPPAMAESFRTMKSLLDGHMLLTQGEVEILPGVRSLPAPGHRLGHMAVELVSEGETLLHLADAILHPIVAEHPDWRTGFDTTQEIIRATRRRLFDRAATSNALVFLSHMPFPGLGHIVREGSAWRWVPLDGDSTA